MGAEPGSFRSSSSSSKDNNNDENKKKESSPAATSYVASLDATQLYASTLGK
jgi:hypothetical protein